jgi:magnesium chelatase family protein
MSVEVPALPPESLHDGGEGEASAAVRQRVIAARQRQIARHDGQCRVNAELTPSSIARHCQMDSGARRVLATAVRRLALSARGYDRVRKVARTIADLAGEDVMAAEHIAESLQFRDLGRQA